MLRDGRADLTALLRRHQLRHADKIHYAGQQASVSYLLFDILGHRGRTLVQESLERRRAVLAEVLSAVSDSRLLLSEGVVGAGRELFERAVAAGQEGVMAKHLDGRYRPGRRSSSWQKIKPKRIVPVVIVGYTPTREGLHSLLVAAVRDGALRYVAELTHGFRAADKIDLARRLRTRQRSVPVVACPHQAVWVEPELYCRVQCLSWTSGGRLRDAVFRGLFDNDG